MGKIFVIDDDEKSALLTKEFLESGGHIVVAISLSKEDGLVQMTELDFDVAVVDGLDGAGAFVARAVREKGRKVVGFSADDVTFGDININRVEGRSVLVKKVGELLGQ